MLLYISTDLNVRSSGGLVASKELEAMKMIDEVIPLSFNEIHPIPNHLPDIPFLIDYLTVDRISHMDLSNVRLAHFYGGCYGQTIKYLKCKNIKTTYSIMFHHRQTSITEHEKYFGTYPFMHVKDDNLWRMHAVEALRSSDVIIVPSSVPRNNILEELNDESEKRIEVIPHGTDIPDRVPDIPEKFDCGYMGAFGPDKGLYYLIKAWEQLDYNDSTLVFAGSQSIYLQQIVNQLQIKHGRYHSIGYVNNISDFYKVISVYIQPSSTESWGLEVPEAMSHGRPIIVSDGAGSSDCVDDGINGFIVHKMNPDKIASSIQYFKDNPSEIKRMGTNARKKSLEYTWKNQQDKYIKLWKELLQ